MDQCLQIKQLKSQLVESQFQVQELLSQKKEFIPSDHEKLLIEIKLQNKFITDLKLENQILQNKNPPTPSNLEIQGLNKQIDSQKQIIQSQQNQLKLVQTQNVDLAGSVSCLQQSQVKTDDPSQLYNLEQSLHKKNIEIKELKSHNEDLKKQVATLQKLLKEAKQ